MLDVGDKLPRIGLYDEKGARVDLAKFKGKPLVLYFYPKDDTSGCAAEAKDFSDLLAEFAKAGADVIGISPDSPESHAKFKTKHALKVRLAADPDKEAAGAFGVWVEKSMYGRKYMGVERSTFLVGKDGRIAKIWRKVKVAGHAEEVLDAVAAMT